MTHDDPVYRAIIAASAALIEPVLRSEACVDAEVDPEDPSWATTYDRECVRCVALVALRAAMPHLRPDLTVPEFLPLDSGTATWEAYAVLHPETETS